jgi:hypothetical protein
MPRTSRGVVLAPLLAFGAHQLVVGVGSRALLHPAARPDDVRLLFLRTFGSRRRSERLLRDVTRPWGYLGTVQIIAGPDLATASRSTSATTTPGG